MEGRRGQAGGRRWRGATGSINHPSDLRRPVVKGGGGPTGGAVKLSLSHPRASPGCLNSHVLLHLLERWQTKELLLPPPAPPLMLFFFALLSRETMSDIVFQLRMNPALSFFFCSYLQTRVQPVTRKLLRPRGVQVRGARFV